MRDFVDEYLLHSAGRCFVVAQDQQIVGLVTPNEVKRISRDEWTHASVQSIMRPLSQVPAVPPDMPAVKAVELMGRDHVNQLAVVSEGKLKGIFSRGQLLRYLQLHSGLGAE